MMLCTKMTMVLRGTLGKNVGGVSDFKGFYFSTMYTKITKVRKILVLKCILRKYWYEILALCLFIGPL